VGPHRARRSALEKFSALDMLTARDDEGTVHRTTWLRAVVERKGRVKIFSTDD